MKCSVWATGESNSGGDTTVPGAGAPYVSAYTVTDAAGNELQRIEEGQKCRIIIAVVDPRISVSTTKADPKDQSKTISKTPEEIAADKANWLTPANGTPLAANVKVTSTASFASPSLGDISTTTFTADKIKMCIRDRPSIIWPEATCFCISSLYCVMEEVW